MPSPSGAARSTYHSHEYLTRLAWDFFTAEPLSARRFFHFKYRVGEGQDEFQRRVLEAGNGGFESLITLGEVITLNKTPANDPDPHGS